MCVGLKAQKAQLPAGHFFQSAGFSPGGSGFGEGRSTLGARIVLSSGMNLARALRSSLLLLARCSALL